ncbi:MAG: isoprenyl transferase [Lentisphaeria bacterium]
MSDLSTTRPSLPRHVAVIMDGNGRWAQQHNLPRIEGHRAGAEAVRRIVEVCSETEVEYLTLYAFSTENWQRPRPEVRQLMALLREFLETRRQDFDKHKIRLNTIGEIERLPKAVQKKLRKTIEETQAHDRGTVTLALNYGSRTEIIRATQSIATEVAAGQLKAADITEELFKRKLFTAGLPDPDLIIRTSGEQRLSNFLLWQASYAELWFTETLWPDFSKAEFRAALEEYKRRQRRYGGHS